MNFCFVVIQKFCYHGNATYQLLLSIARMSPISDNFFEKGQKVKKLTCAVCFRISYMNIFENSSLSIISQKSHMQNTSTLQSMTTNLLPSPQVKDKNSPLLLPGNVFLG